MMPGGMVVLPQAIVDALGALATEVVGNRQAAQHMAQHATESQEQLADLRQRIQLAVGLLQAEGGANADRLVTILTAPETEAEPA